MARPRKAERNRLILEHHFGPEKKDYDALEEIFSLSRSTLHELMKNEIQNYSHEYADKKWYPEAVRRFGIKTLSTGEALA